MKLFVSWSGTRIQAVAIAESVEDETPIAKKDPRALLKELEPFFSEETVPGMYFVTAAPKEERWIVSSKARETEFS